ncbi:carboxypeptidase-like regulatory domain-containing protein [Niabella sp. W65]|nr:carboxypeptidase-like regulatory domain-containing protein [Niabella sp. W65]MCH7364765.1 carboxypeptidase-like regulatory domain-containing protein [Niabella sp. W65]ULT40608.1 carboxypeptidase-like regulatory domain-containing protein [Niabella sp. I65]
MKPQKRLAYTQNYFGAFSLFFLASANAGAQTKKISGVVLSQPQGAPAAGATVEVKNTNRATTTDSTGAFTIEAAAGEILLVSRVGF